MDTVVEGIEAVVGVVPDTVLEGVVPETVLDATLAVDAVVVLMVVVTKT